MSLSFTGIYKLSDANQNYIKVPQIAMAPRKVMVKDPDSGEQLEQYQFLVANDVNLGHTISGEVTLDEDGVTEIEDTQRQGHDGKPVLWRFEPLTLKLWNEMGEAGAINGWDAQGSEIKDDAELMHFYRYEWLMPRLEWWQEHPEDPESPTKSKKGTESETPEPTE